MKQTSQPSLFEFAERRAIEPTAKARAGSPEASTEAAAEINRRGETAGQCKRIGEALEEVAVNLRMSHKTPGEIAAFINERDKTTFYDAVRVLKRMANLRDMGLAAKFGERTCATQKRKCGVWVWVESCCGDPKNHAAARMPESDFETVLCKTCTRALGLRRVSP